MRPTGPPDPPQRAPLLHSPSGAVERAAAQVDANPLEIVRDAATGAGALLAAPKVPNAVAVAVEFGRAGNGWAGALVFNVWLRRQLRERRLSQRQLAARSGVNHSTISRLLNDGRAPSLDTATKLAHALRLDWSDEDVAAYFDLLADRPLMPAQRVEQALRGDDSLSDEDVRLLMRQYLAARSKGNGRGDAEDRHEAAFPPPRASGRSTPADPPSLQLRGARQQRARAVLRRDSATGGRKS